MNEWSRWEQEKMIGKAAAALTKNGFAVEVASDAAEAVQIVLGFAANAKTVGFGGSIGVIELGLPKMLAEMGKECLIHGAPGLANEERVEVMRRALTCDLYLTGVNAVSLDGRLVDIDATGNRVGAMTFGPKKVVVIAGANKLAATAEAAMKRVKEYAAPANAARLSMQTPCAVTGFCADCDSPQRICRIVHVMERRPRVTDITVVLVAEDLGL